MGFDNQEGRYKTHFSSRTYLQENNCKFSVSAVKQGVYRSFTAFLNPSIANSFNLLGTVEIKVREISFANRAWWCGRRILHGHFPGFTDHSLYFLAIFGINLVSVLGPHKCSGMLKRGSSHSRSAALDDGRRENRHLRTFRLFYCQQPFSIGIQTFHW